MLRLYKLVQLGKVVLRIAWSENIDGATINFQEFGSDYEVDM